MRNCPDKYYKNCRNALARCQACRAGWGSKGYKLYYDPIETSLDVHPAQIKDFTLFSQEKPIEWKHQDGCGRSDER